PSPPHPPTCRAELHSPRPPPTQSVLPVRASGPILADSSPVRARNPRPSPEQTVLGEPFPEWRGLTDGPSLASRRTTKPSTHLEGDPAAARHDLRRKATSLDESSGANPLNPHADERGELPSRPKPSPGNPRCRRCERSDANPGRRHGHSARSVELADHRCGPNGPASRNQIRVAPVQQARRHRHSAASDVRHQSREPQLHSGRPHLAGRSPPSTLPHRTQSLCEMRGEALPVRKSHSGCRCISRCLTHRGAAPASQQAFISSLRERLSTCGSEIRPPISTESDDGSQRTKHQLTSSF